MVISGRISLWCTFTENRNGNIIKQQKYKIASKQGNSRDSHKLYITKMTLHLSTAKTNMTTGVSLEDCVECDERYLPTTNQFKTGIGSEAHTAMLVVSIMLTIALYLLYFYHVYMAKKYVHKSMCIDTFWITSVFPFMLLMSVIALFIPRAHDFLTAVKIIYMSIGISHFTKLTLIQFGGKLPLITSLEQSPLHGIVDRYCTCIPWVPTSRESVLLLFWLTYQMPWSEALYFVIGIATVIGKSGPDGEVGPISSLMWLTVLNLLSFFSGVIALQLIVYLSHGQLQQYNYDNKALAMKLLVIFTKLQSLILDILLNSGAFPSHNVFFNARVYKQSIQNGIYILEISVLGTYTLLLYSRAPINKTSESVEGNTNHAMQNDVESGNNITEKNSDKNGDNFEKNKKESYKCMDNIEKDMEDIDLETNNVEVISNNTNDT